MILLFCIGLLFVQSIISMEKKSEIGVYSYLKQLQKEDGQAPSKPSLEGEIFKEFKAICNRVAIAQYNICQAHKLYVKANAETQKTIMSELESENGKKYNAAIAEAINEFKRILLLKDPLVMENIEELKNQLLALNFDEQKLKVAQATSTKDFKTKINAIVSKDIEELVLTLTH